ncbi:MAG: CHAT domain-containing tetratricopeptide repeat protein, partial [Syntrophobacteraceae bacterium]
VDWAETTNNVANIYLYRMLGNPAQNVEKAIRLYQEVLTFRNRDNMPEDWAETMHNLGIAYFTRKMGRHEENLRQAISCYHQSLEIRKREIIPEKWAKTMTNLGNAFIHLMASRKANIEKGIACYEQALKVRGRDSLPTEWAETKNNLGLAYTELFKIEPSSEIKKTAVDIFVEVFEVHTLDGMPEGYRLTQRNLGNLFFAAQNWEKAYGAYIECLRAGELLFQSGSGTSARQSQLIENHEASPNAAYCLIRMERYTEAIEVIEKAKARALAEALALGDAPLEAVTEGDRSDFETVRGRIAELESELRSSGQEGSREYAEISSDLSGTRQSLDQIVKRIRKYAPGFLSLEFRFENIKELVDRLQYPLVYLFTTAHGSLALLVLPKMENMKGEHVVRLNDFKESDLNSMLFNQGDRERYLAGIVNGNEETLRDNLDKSWPVLSKTLMKPLADRLNAFGHSEACLIASGMLELLPLHAMTPERCVFSGSPSARVLQSALNSLESRQGFPPSLLGVYNPLPTYTPLPFASIEIKGGASVFNDSRTYTGKEATYSAIIDSSEHSTHLHFASHGTFHYNDVLNSAIALANGEELRLRDILDGNINLSSIRLAVLSACQTGIIDFQNAPDEMIGMPSGFLQAGVPGVISTLWPVDDASTAILLTRFYELHLREGLEPGVALHAAQLWLREATAADMGLTTIYQALYEASGRRDPDALRWMRYYQANPAAKPYTHPYYWAAFY